MVNAAKPIDDWLGDPSITPALRAKLVLVQNIRAYAATTLGLPSNKSYTSYADLKRPFVVWNVTAAPALSLQMRQWCFPVVGCVSYRGYYDKAKAEAFANRYREVGEDVQVAGVAAYSTLGFFSDPVLNTFIQYPDAELARLVFHELSHQVVYIKNDTTFNESFATAVEIIGVQRWLADKNDEQLTKAYIAYEARRKDFSSLLLKYKKRLEVLYQSSQSDTQKQQGKAQIFTELKAEYEAIKIERWDGFKGYDRYFSQSLGNAHLGSVATYNDKVPGFLALANQYGNNLPAFFEAVKSLSKLDKPERDALLEKSLLARPSQNR